MFGHWTSGDLDTALLFDSLAEAEQARQALLAESVVHVQSGNNPSCASERFWFDIYGGLVVATEVERIIRRRQG